MPHGVINRVILGCAPAMSKRFTLCSSPQRCTAGIKFFVSSLVIRGVR